MSGARKGNGQGFFSRLLSPLVAPFAFVSPRTLLCAALVVGLLAAVYAGWRTFGPQVVADPSYHLTADKIEITPQPTWIRCDVRAEVAEHMLREPKDIRDRQLTVELAQAFARHPWVAHVRRVSKSHPARVVVQLDYRQPVAMVEVVSAEGQHWLYPVDAEGVLLPTEDFSPERALTFPRISAGDTMYTGAAGAAWGDRRVHGGARIAAALSAHWHRLGLYRITAVSEEQRVSLDPEPVFELSTRAGGRIRWGHPPGQEEAAEPTCEEKIQRILVHAQQAGGLDASDQPMILDLRRSPSGGRSASPAETYGVAPGHIPGAPRYGNPPPMPHRQINREESTGNEARTLQEGSGVGSARVSPF